MKQKNKCNKCKYEWIIKVKEPMECPACKTRYWNSRKYPDVLKISHTCQRCDYRWKSLLSMPKKCPACKSRYWNEKRKKKK